MAEAVGSAFFPPAKLITGQVQKPGKPIKENAAEVRGVLISIREICVELLRYRLLEHAIHLFIGRITAGLAGLGSLQSLVGGALCAVSR